MNVYLADPFHPMEQARQIDWLIGHIRAQDRPLIVAGDFNLTPFSAKLTNFCSSDRAQAARDFAGKLARGQIPSNVPDRQRLRLTRVRLGQCERGSVPRLRPSPDHRGYHYLQNGVRYFRKPRRQKPFTISQSVSMPARAIAPRKLPLDVENFALASRS